MPVKSDDLSSFLIISAIEPLPLRPRNLANLNFHLICDKKVLNSEVRLQLQKKFIFVKAGYTPAFLK